jgi:hypothetical protein
MGLNGSNMPKYSILSLTLLLSISGCSTPWVKPAKQVVQVQTFKDDTEVTGLDCTLQNNFGQWALNSPGKAEVITSAEDLVITCTAPKDERGTTSATATPTPAFLTNPTAAIIVPAGNANMIDQQLRGFSHVYPNEIHVLLNQDIIVTASE